MLRLTRQEQWASFVLAMIVLGAIAGRTWLRSRPPAQLPTDPAPSATAR